MEVQRLRIFKRSSQTRPHPPVIFCPLDHKEFEFIRHKNIRAENKQLNRTRSGMRLSFSIRRFVFLIWFGRAGRNIIIKRKLNLNIFLSRWGEFEGRNSSKEFPFPNNYQKEIYFILPGLSKLKLVFAISFPLMVDFPQINVGLHTN